MQPAAVPAAPMCRMGADVQWLTVKVVRLIARLNVGGPARHVTLLNAGLQARGHQTVLVYGALDAGEASLEGPALELGIPLEREAHLGRSISATSDLRAFVAVLRLLFRYQPDVIHTHTAKAGALGRVAALLYNATRRRSSRALIVHTFHGHVFEGYFSPAMNRMVRLSERLLAAAADVIVTISPRQREDIVTRFAVAPAAKTVVVPLGLDLDRLLALDLPSATPASRSGDEVVIGYAGRMVPVKALPTLLRAFARAVAVAPRLRLVLAGDGPEREAAEALVDTLGVRTQVQFIGWVSDLPGFYASLDIFALSSINEGTPVAVIEAMAAGRPVVATAVGGVPDVVEDGASGLLAPSGDVDAMAAAFVRLASDTPLRHSMGHAGRHLVLQRYSHRRLVADVEALYVEGLTRKRR